MWIVRLALRRPYTFVVAAMLIAILGGAAIATLPVDIFPYIDIPVVSIVWQYNGLTPEEMESRIVTNFERALTANVVGIEHIESQSHQTVAVVRVYFHPGTSVDLALSQIVTQCQVQVRNMPPGTFPPQVLKYDAASVPVLQLGLSSRTLTEQELFDLGNNFIRTPLATVQGASVSYPFGSSSTKLATPAASHAASTSSQGASGRAPVRLSRSGIENRIGRCVTIATARRSSAISTSRASTPPIRTRPSLGS